MTLSGGGIAGWSGRGDALMTRCYATGAVSGEGAVGGLIGYLSKGIVENCYALGTITASERVGGLLGYSTESMVTNCFSGGRIQTQLASVGGLIGDDSRGTVTASFWDTDTSGQFVSSGGTGKVTLAMMLAATFTEAGWDFVSVWDIDEGLSYPFLRGLPRPNNGEEPVSEEGEAYPARDGEEPPSDEGEEPPNWEGEGFAAQDGETTPQEEGEQDLVELAAQLLDDFEDADADDDNALSLDEAQDAMPELTAEEFALLDDDSDGLLVEAELWQAAEVEEGDAGIPEDGEPEGDGEQAVSADGEPGVDGEADGGAEGGPESSAGCTLNQSKHGPLSARQLSGDLLFAGISMLVLAGWGGLRRGR